MAKAQLPKEFEASIRAIVARHGTNRDQLLPILQEIQGSHNWINPTAQQIVADLLDIHPVEVNSVVSFYSMLHDQPGGRYRIRLCNTISCELAGKTEIAARLEKELGISFGETTSDCMFTLEYAACMGMCDQGPALLLNNKVFTLVTPESVMDIIEQCRKDALVPAGGGGGGEK